MKADHGFDQPAANENAVSRKRMRARNARPTVMHAGPRAPGNSASALVYQVIRREIVSMQRKPGEPIVEKELGFTFGVSRTPIREAILRLADEGLVEVVPQSGTFVARIPLDALPEAFIIRRALEEVTVRAAAERATKSQITGLHAILELQREKMAADDREGFHEADQSFHAAIAEAAGHPGIWMLVQQVMVQVDRYRRLTLPQPGRMERVIAEHVGVTEAIAEHDVEKAAAAIDAHIDGLRVGLEDFPDHNPDYFFGDLSNGMRTTL
jgi:DNA-binding GntR family transcriptional regulator